MFFTSPLAQASWNSDFEMSPLPSLSTCVKLTMKGAAADLASRSPDGTAFFQIASHCSGFRAAEGRPDVMVFVCASAQVAVNGSATMEMMNALNICLLLVLAKFTLRHHRKVASMEENAQYLRHDERQDHVSHPTRFSCEPGGRPK